MRRRRRRQTVAQLRRALGRAERSVENLRADLARERSRVDAMLYGTPRLEVTTSDGRWSVAVDRVVVRQVGPTIRIEACSDSGVALVGRDSP